MNGVCKNSIPEIVSALKIDVADLNCTKFSITSSYVYGKLIARAARLALIAEEVAYLDAIPVVVEFLKEAIEPWLDGSFVGNGFVYIPKWGGLLTKQGALNPKVDFGFGLYNDHHYQLGYFCYAIAVLVKFDLAWGRRFRPQVYALLSDFMYSGDDGSSGIYTKLRCFDMYKLHSWAGGLIEYWDGRNQESTSEAVSAYYAAALIGLAYGDDSGLVSLGSTLMAVEIEAAKTWWHVRAGEGMYDDGGFSREQRVVGIVWSNKRTSNLWFAPLEHRECRLGIQALPILPVTEVLFGDVAYTRGLVEWSMSALKRGGAKDGWKGFVYALRGVYDKQGALMLIRGLKGFDDGNSRSNLLWWIHSRAKEDEDEEDERTGSTQENPSFVSSVVSMIKAWLAYLF